jgi:hypothetical protein
MIRHGRRMDGCGAPFMGLMSQMAKIGAL